MLMNEACEPMNEACMLMNEACEPMNEACMLMNEACMPMNEVFFQGTKKSRGILEGESPRQLKSQRPV